MLRSVTSTPFGVEPEHVVAAAVGIAVGADLHVEGDGQSLVVDVTTGGEGAAALLEGSAAPTDTADAADGGGHAGPVVRADLLGGEGDQHHAVVGVGEEGGELVVGGEGDRGEPLDGGAELRRQRLDHRR